MNRISALPTAVVSFLCISAAQAQLTEPIPMGTFGPGAASGTLANGVEWSVDKGLWYAPTASNAQGYIIYPNRSPQTPQTWTFSPAASLRFGVAGLNCPGECTVVPEGSVVESIAASHSWDAALRRVCGFGNVPNDTSFFTLDAPQTTLVLQAQGANNCGRGVVLIEATVEAPVVDLSITKSVDPEAASVGEAVTYTLVVGNGGPESVDGAVITDPSVPELDCTTLSCSAAGGAGCPTSPTPAQLAAGLAIPILPEGGSLTLTLSCTLTAGP